MKPKNLLIVFALFAFVLSVYVVFEQIYVPKKEAKEKSKGKIFSLDKDDIDTIKIEKKGREIILKREEDNGRWLITSPVKTDADAAEVVSYLAKALDAEKIKELGTKDEIEANLHDFGLKNSALSLTLATGEKTETLYVGNSTPTEDSVYGMSSEDNLIFTAKKSVFSDLDIDLVQLRKRALVAFPLKSTREFKVERGGKSVRLSRTSLGSWRIVDPIDFPADKEEVKEIYNFIYDSKAEKFLDNEELDLEKYGLKEPLITFSAVDKGGAISLLKIGGKDEEGNYYAKLEGLPWVFTVKEAVKSKLTLSAETFMDKIILEYIVGDVLSFTVSAGDSKIKCERKDKTWEITAPEAAFGDKAAVDNFLWDFKDLKFNEVVEKPAKNLKKYGLDSPVVVFTVEYKMDDDSKKESKVAIGKVEGEMGYGYSQGFSKGDDFIFSFPSEKIGNLRPTFFDLKDKSLLRFVKEDVSYLKIVWDSETYEFQHKRNKWKVISPEDKSIDTDDVMYLLGTVRDMAYFEIISSNKGKKALGLDKPKRIITIKNKEQEDIGEIRFGKIDEEKGYIPVESSLLKDIFGIKPNLVKELDDELKDLFK